MCVFSGSFTSFLRRTNACVALVNDKCGGESCWSISPFSRVSIPFRRCLEGYALVVPKVKSNCCTVWSSEWHSIEKYMFFADKNATRIRWVEFKCIVLQKCEFFRNPILVASQFAPMTTQFNLWVHVGIWNLSSSIFDHSMLDLLLPFIPFRYSIFNVESIDWDKCQTKYFYRIAAISDKCCIVKYSGCVQERKN